jgi:hypothetical protein
MPKYCGKCGQEVKDVKMDVWLKLKLEETKKKMLEAVQPLPKKKFYWIDENPK